MPIIALCNDFIMGKWGKTAPLRNSSPISFHWLNVLKVGNFDFEVMGKWGKTPPP